MRGWIPAAALGGLLALLAVGALLALRPADATRAERAESLVAGLRCPDCQGLSVADSPTRSAQEIRRQVEALLVEGASDDEVRAHFVARYGDWILLAPSAPVVWLIPFAVVLAGGGLLAVWLVRRQAAPERVGPAVSPDERQRLHEEAEALDA